MRCCDSGSKGLRKEQVEEGKGLRTAGSWPYPTPALRRAESLASVERERCLTRVTFGDARFGGGRIFGREIRDPFHHVAIIPQPGPGCAPIREIGQD